MNLCRYSALWLIVVVFCDLESENVKLRCLGDDCCCFVSALLLNFVLFL